MNNEGQDDEHQAVSIIQALGQVQKQSTALDQLKRVKEEFDQNRDSSLDTQEEISLAALRVTVWEKNPDAVIRSLNEQHITFEGITLERVSVPPIGYAYKGGAARLALLELLGEQVGKRRPRDIDLVRIGVGKNKNDEAVADEFMQEDSKFGHGVEIIRSIDDYMHSRDLTINEILYFEDRIIATLRCVQDTLHSLLRFTPWSKKEENTIPSKTFLKALRFLAESTVEGRPLTLESTEAITIPTPFDIALHLERALEKSTRVAEVFCSHCVQYGVLPSKLQGKSVGDIISYLMKQEPSLQKKFKHFRANSSKPQRKIL